MATSGTTPAEIRTNSFSASLKSVSKALKAHHESVNAAYATYYGTHSNVATPMMSPRASIDGTTILPQTTSTTAAPVTPHNTAIETHKSESKAKKAWEKALKLAKEHHDSVNAAANAYWGAGVNTRSRVGSNDSSIAATPRASFEEVGESSRKMEKEGKQEKEEKKNGLWEKAMRRLKEHHESVEAAAHLVRGW